jgi:hypothetical protein
MIAVDAGFTLPDFEHIVQNLRAADRHELAVVGMNPTDLAWGLAAQAADAWMFYLDGEPVFLWGTTEVWPHTRGLWGFGTEKTRRIIPWATRWGRSKWLPQTFQHTAVRRIEVRLPTTALNSRRWLASIGMTEETELLDYGVNGERGIQMAYTLREFERDFPDVSISKDTAARDASRSSYEVERADTGRS